MQWDENRRGLEGGFAGDGLVVRPADPGELAQIAELKRTVELETYAGLGTPAELEARIRTRCTAEFLARCLSPADALFVATREAELIGMGAVRLRRETSGPDAPEGGGGTVAHLHSLYCRLRGVGVGRAVSEVRLAWARANGATRVTADCFVGNDAAARHLARLGLVEVVPPSPSVDFAHARVRHFVGDIMTAIEAGRVTPRWRSPKVAAA